MSLNKISDWLGKNIQKNPQPAPAQDVAHVSHAASSGQTTSPAHQPQGQPLGHPQGHQHGRPQGQRPSRHHGLPQGYQSGTRPTPRQPQPQYQQQGGELKGKKLRIVPLGGLEEVGKNIMAIEFEDDIVIVDCGMSFAGSDMLGVDYIVPDVSYLEQRRRNVRAIIFTHGHLDHIGAIQYVLPKLGNPPLYGTKLTCGLIKNRLAEFSLDKSAKIHEFNENAKLKFGKLEVEFFRVNHSIPDGVGVFIKSPAGNIVHTGDFKFDYKPAIDKPADFQRIAQIGTQGVDALLIDSTNALKPGFCKSEQEIGENLENIIAKTKGRLIVTSFSSLIGRINQLCNYGAKHGRKVFLSGRSMIENMELAEKLGYTDYPKGAVKPINNSVNTLPPSQVIILTTGSQGEAMSALTRMSFGEHAQVQIREGDTVVISASPIPGNELAIVNVINNLYHLGAKVITHGQMDVHTSGHAHQEELKLMYNLLKPRCYVPIHGELFMRVGHADMIKTIAEPNLHVTILENGDVLEITKQGARKSKQKVPANDILVDGLGFGDIGSKVIQEREIMSSNGILLILFRAYEKTRRLIGDPDIITRGFVYMKESQTIAMEVKQVAKKAYEQIMEQKKDLDLHDFKNEIRLHVNRFIKKRLGREPMIIPLVMYI